MFDLMRLKITGQDCLLKEIISTIQGVFQSIAYDPIAIIDHSMDIHQQNTGHSLS
jgi:hypothetical protein